MTTSYRNHLKLGLKARLSLDGFGEVHPANGFLLFHLILWHLRAIFRYNRPASFIASSPSRIWGKAAMLYAVK